MIQLYEEPGWGSAIIEFQLILYGMDYELVRVGDLYARPEVRQVLAPVNPLQQIPTLILPGGEVMTETAAMTLYLAELAGSDRVVPAPLSKDRAAFLRWLIFIVSAIYPAFAYGLEPERFADRDGVARYQTAMFEKHFDLWRIMEAEAARRGGPWFLGERFSAIDFYIVTMVEWRDGREWFARETPSISRIAEAVAQIPELRAAMRRNFG